MAKHRNLSAQAFAAVIVAEFADSDVRPITVRLICNLLLDLPLTPAQANDFGVTTPDHYRALKAIFDAEESADLRQLGEELDHALGNGPALTALVRKYAPRYKAIRFETRGVARAPQR